MREKKIEVAYFVTGEAEISLTGEARLIDSDGNIVRRADLSELGVLRCEISAMNSEIFPGRYGLTFRVDDVFPEE